MVGVTDDFGRTPPQDLAAEQSVLGAMMLSARAINDVVGVVAPQDFYRPAHELVFQAAVELNANGQPVDAVTVAAELTKRGELTRVGGASYLHTLISSVPTAGNAGYYAEIVAEVAVLRRMVDAGTKIVQLGYTGGGDAASLVEQARQEMARVAPPRGFEDVHVPSLREFMDIPDEEYDWVVPGLLERSDRLILTGGEGLGKSTLFRQLAVCIAAGVHPFDGSRIKPQRTFVVDCENGPTHIRRKMRPLMLQARVQGLGAEDTLFIEGRPEGLNLLNPADANWLLRRVRALKPAVLFTGSLYKLFEDDPNKEQPARQVAAVLDQCRAEGNSAVVLEAHSGHGSSEEASERQVRPIGASLWKRWPEFGYGLRPAKDFHPQLNRRVQFVPWRGDRDERDWPKELVAGSVWPWQMGSSTEWGGAA